MFFGRAEDAVTVLDLWMANRLTVVTGPPASGKTSLMLAGVYPLMCSSKNSATHSPISSRHP
jgi:recombinational DNA repair ATPase RecF